jgi:adenylosuccinate lyase
MPTLSPLDDRYFEAVKELVPVFSEMGLVKRRLEVECQYLVWLMPLVTGKVMDKRLLETLTRLVDTWGENDFRAVKAHEKVCKHDVKAVEYFLRDRLDSSGLADYKQWVHFGLTSEDTNNIAQTLQLREGSMIVLGALKDMLLQLGDLIQDGRAAVMLGRTHGQPAVPTTMGKELLVHLHALLELGEALNLYEYRGKLGGAVGTQAAHYHVFPKVNWDRHESKFLKQFGLTKEPVNTQVLSPNSWVGLFSLWSRVALLLEGLAKDLWWYVALNYFDQKTTSGQVGSSTMPQKVNPIKLENSEGNAQMAYALLELQCRVFSYSRLQRDLSDSTVRRNFGVSFGHLLLAIRSMEAGLKSLVVNQEVMTSELDTHFEILGEAVQSTLRSRGEFRGYEHVKDTVQGKTLTKDGYRQWIERLKLASELEKELMDLTPNRYIGNAIRQVSKMMPGLTKRIHLLAVR